MPHLLLASARQFLEMSVAARRAYRYWHSQVMPITPLLISRRRRSVPFDAMPNMSDGGRGGIDADISMMARHELAEHRHEFCRMPCAGRPPIEGRRLMTAERERAIYARIAILPITRISRIIAASTTSPTISPPRCIAKNAAMTLAIQRRAARCAVAMTIFADAAKCRKPASLISARIFFPRLSPRSASRYGSAYQTAPRGALIADCAVILSPGFSTIGYYTASDGDT